VPARHPAGQPLRWATVHPGAGAGFRPGLTVDRFKFTTVAHADHDFLGPLSSTRADALVERLVGLAPGDRALDVGCGKAEFLMRAAARWVLDGLGVDWNPAFVAEARRRAASRGAAVEVREGDAAALDVTPGSIALAICLGASQAFGGYDATLLALHRLVRPGGLALLGEGYWKRPPDPGYLEALGGSAEEATDDDGNIARARRAGWTPLHVATSDLAEWDDYEDRYANAVERHAREHPDDPDAPAMLGRIRAWRAAYEQWGRDTLGFGFYLLRR
jgi:methyltransferase family protein